MKNMTSKRVEKQDASDSCRLYVGTSGYAYKEWMDAGFYPAGIKSSGMLSFYAERFSITELNYTWYQMPKVETVERQRRQVPSEFLFAAKLNRTLTHEIQLELPYRVRRHDRSLRTHEAKSVQRTLNDTCPALNTKLRPR